MSVRHCERSEAIRSDPASRRLDCFVALLLAMTRLRCKLWPQHYMVRALTTSGAMMTGNPAADTHTRAIRLWLYAVAALVLAMVLVGGATRLTESGLSITEWQPVMGTLPPLSARDWQDAFEKYQAIPQYRAFNAGMSLDDVQDDLLVGMDASSARPADRRGVFVAVCLVSVARLGRAVVAAAAVVHFRARRAARRGRLVDGRLGPRRAHRSLAISAGDPSDPRLRDLRGADLDRAAAGCCRCRSVSLCCGGGQGGARLRSRRRRAFWFSCCCRSISARSSPDCAPATSTTPGR